MNRQVALFAMLFLLLGTSGVSAQENREQGRQQEHQQQAAPQHQERQPQAAPAQHQQPAQTNRAHAPQAIQRRQAPPQQSYGGAYHGWVKPTGPTHGGVHHSGVPQNETQARAGFDQSHAHQWDNEHHSWAQRGGYHGYRIPDDRFRAYFGRDHHFRIYGLPLLFVGGYPRFQYDGYWVTLVDPWPESWPSNWYEVDDVYLDYTDDGYYLYDVTRGGPGIAVTVAD